MTLGLVQRILLGLSGVINQPIFKLVKEGRAYLVLDESDRILHELNR
jgi:hypothetical protein